MKCPETGKRCLTQAQAKEQAAALRRKAFLPSERNTQAYRCPHWKSHGDAGHFHIGRTLPRRFR